jgi:hypothetical protein
MFQVLTLSSAAVFLLAPSLFSPQEIHVHFVTNTVVLGQVLLQELSFFT